MSTNHGKVLAEVCAWTEAHGGPNGNEKEDAEIITAQLEKEGVPFELSFVSNRVGSYMGAKYFFYMREDPSAIPVSLPRDNRRRENAEKRHEMAQRLLDLELPENALGAPTVPVYFARILAHIWARGGYFTTERLFGNGPWQFDIHKAMIRAGLVKGEIRNTGDIEWCDWREADAIVLAAIDLFGASANAGEEK